MARSRRHPDHPSDLPPRRSHPEGESPRSDQVGRFSDRNDEEVSSVGLADSVSRNPLIMRRPSQPRAPPVKARPERRRIIRSAALSTTSITVNDLLATGSPCLDDRASVDGTRDQDGDTPQPRPTGELLDGRGGELIDGTTPPVWIYVTANT